MTSPSQQALHVLYPSLPVPPKSGNTAPSQSGANAPTLVKCQEGRKIYTVRGVTFEVDQHYEVIKAIGLGAYGLVCSAIDLRYVPGSPFHDKEMVDREMHGGMVLKAMDGKMYRYTPPPTHQVEGQKKPSGNDPPAVVVPSLRYDPYTRGKLSNGLPSPYVAIKKVPKLFNDLVDGKRVLREVKILQHLRGHENIVRLHDLLYPRQPKDTFRDLYIVTELLDTDLHLVLKSRQPLEEDHLRFIVYQLIKSLVYTHSSGIIHRDLKPGNLLLTGSCELKVCDFGLARGGIFPTSDESGSGGNNGNSGAGGGEAQAKAKNLNVQPNLVAASPMLDQLPKKPSLLSYEKSVDSKQLTPQTSALLAGGNHAMQLTDYVITRYYRPPELLIMSHYGRAVDMWSVGCIFAEIILHKPVFPGKDYLSQLTMIAQTPGLCNMPRSAEQLDQMFVGGTEGKNYLKDLLFGRSGSSGAGGVKKKSLGDSPQTDSVSSPGKANSLEALRTSMFGPDGQRYISDAAMSFLGPALSFDPFKRPTALEALRHPYFSKMYAPEDELWKDNFLAPHSRHCKQLTAEEAAKEKQYESEEEDQVSMWEFDPRDVDENGLRDLFWEEIEKVQRRRERFARPGAVIARLSADASASPSRLSPNTQAISPARVNSK